MTTMVFYNTNTSSSTLSSTAKTLLENPSTASNATNLNTNLTSGTTGWVEMWSFGNGTSQSGAGSEPSPTGHGWIDDNTTFEGQHFAAGTWTWKVEMETSVSGTFVADIHCRAYQRTSGGTYNLIAEGVATGQSFTSASYTTFTVTASGASASNTFGTGDKFYTDLILNITTNSASPNMRVHMAGSTTIGYVNGAATVNITTPGYLSSTQINKDVAFRGRIKALVNKDVAFRGRLSQLVDKDIKFRGNVGLQAIKDIKFRGILSQLIRKDVAFRGRIDILTAKDVVFRARPANTVDKDIRFRGRISGPRILSGGMAVFANGTGTATFDSVRWTQYPDPAMSLASVIPRIGTTSIVTNAIVPTYTGNNTSISYDGVNWTNVSSATPIFETRSQSLVTVSGTTAAWTHAISNLSNRILLVGVVLQSNVSISSITYGSQNLTLISAINSGSSLRISLWYLLAPAVGSNTITVTATSSTTFAAGSVSYFNVQQVAPSGAVTNTGTGTTASVTLTGLTTAQTIIELAATDGTYQLTSTAGQNLRWANWAKAAGYQADFPVIAAGSTTLTWSIPLSDTWAEIAVPLTAASGQATTLPNINSQPAPTVDTFAVNSLANYTSTARTGGVAATWADDTVNARMLGSGGTNALLLNSTISAQDVLFFADLDWSETGGIAFNVVDASNFYYLQVTDTLTASGTANTATLYKVVSNVQTQLAQATLTYIVGNNPGSHYTWNFVRQTFHRFLTTVLSGVITCSIDGVQLFQYTDSSPLGAGKCGLFTNGGTLRCYQLWITPQGDYVSGNPTYDIVTGKFVYAQQTLTTMVPYATPQVQDISMTAATPEIQNGAVIPNVTYTNTFTNKAFDDLASASGSYTWYITDNKHFIFNDQGTSPAPWILQSSPMGLVPSVDLEIGNDQVNSSNNSKGGNMELDVQNPLYRNRQVILGALTVTSILTETKTGDGSTRTFPVNYPVNVLFSIILNGNVQTVGQKGQSGFQFYWLYNDSNIVQDANQPTVQNGDELIIIYTGLIPANITVDDTTEQARIQAIEGGSGIVEDVEDHSQDNPQLSTAQAIDLANSLLNKYAIDGRQLIFDTSRNGLQLGQTLTIFLPEHGIWNGQFIITEIETHLMKDINDQQIWWYKVTCSELFRVASWAKLLASGLGLGPLNTF